MANPTTEREKMARFNARNQLAAQLIPVVVSSAIKNVEELNAANSEKVRTFVFGLADSILSQIESEAPDAKAASLSIPPGA